MALTEDQKIACIHELIAFVDPSPFNFSKVDIKAAIDAADTWAGSNAASFNTALPNPFKNTATPEMKAALLAFVALRRAGK